MRLISPCCLLGGATLFAGLSGCEEEPLPPIPIENFVESALQAECVYLVRCSWLPESQACDHALVVDREIVQLVEDAENGIVLYDDIAARAYVSALSTKRCQFTVSAEREVEEAFRKVFTGSIGPGEPCLVDAECSGDSICDRAACEGVSACCAGVCVGRPALVGVGGDCSVLPCVDNAYCSQDPDAGTAVCTERPGNGQPCEGQFTCVEGMGCDPNGGKCYTLSASGVDCNPGLADACLNYNEWCSTESEKCVALPGAGAPCGTNGSFCALHTFCDGAMVCQPRSSLNGPCMNGDECIGDLECFDNFCVTPEPPTPCESMEPPPTPE